jgi:hypothetical protein
MSCNSDLEKYTPHSKYITVTRNHLFIQVGEHLNSPPVFSDVRVVRSLVFCVMFDCPIVLVFFVVFF